VHSVPSFGSTCAFADGRLAGVGQLVFAALVSLGIDMAQLANVRIPGNNIKLLSGLACSKGNALDTLAYDSMHCTCVPWFVTVTQPLGSLSRKVTLRAIDGFPSDSLQKNTIMHLAFVFAGVAMQSQD
jgi:hypothetical protein